MSLLFISHSSKDAAAAQTLRDRLYDKGYSTEGSVFLDFDANAGIQAGQEWEQTLYRNIRASRAVIVLCSAASMASRWCFVEITNARALGKHLFPVKIEDCQLDGLLTDHQVVDLTKGPDQGYERLFQGLFTSGLDPGNVLNWNSRRSPYPGLLAFQEEDAAVFFGRDREIAEGLDLLNKVRRMGDRGLVMVLGGSGSGKSSLVRAGIVPRLRCDVERWIVIDPFRPGETPAAALAEVLARAFQRYGRAVERSAIENTIEESYASRATAAPATVPPTEQSREDTVRRVREVEAALNTSDAPEPARRYARLLRTALEDATRAATPNTAGGTTIPLLDLTNDLRRQAGREQARVLLIIDQFEELLNHKDNERLLRFLAALRACAEAPGTPLLLLGTMRSDFMEQFQNHPQLTGFSWEPLSVGPMSAADIAQVIEKPAALAGIELETGLTQAMLADAGTADALPLLAFTLRELADHHAGDRLLTIEEYSSKLGGLQGAVANAAEELVHGIQPRQEFLLKRAFLRMARLAETGSYTKVPVAWSELDPEVHPILERFVERRLLVSDDKGAGRMLEVRHEALFRSWHTLQGWLVANAETLRLTSEIEQAEAAWRVAGKPEEYLWRGARLDRASELEKSNELELDAAGREFISVSKQVADHHRKQEIRRLRMIVAVVSLLFLISAVAGVYGWQKQREARESAVKATQSAEQARQQLEEAEKARLRVQIGNLVTQIQQVEAEIKTASDKALRAQLQVELTEINGRADDVTRALLARLAAPLGFRGDLSTVAAFEVGASGEESRPLAFWDGRDVELIPATVLGMANEADVRKRYQDLLTPGQYQSAINLVGKRGDEARSLWDASPRLHNVTVSRHLATVLMADDLLANWSELTRRTPALTGSGVPPSVQTATLYVRRIMGAARLKQLDPLVSAGDWMAFAERLENLLSNRRGKTALLKVVQDSLSTLATAIRKEAQPSRPAAQTQAANPVQ